MSNDVKDDQQNKPGGPGGNHPFKVTVHTLAGHRLIETVKPEDSVSEVTAKAIKVFGARGQLVPGDYALTLPRTGGEAELDPTASLRHAGVVAEDVLVLVNRKPQVDG
ncbi:hypothetical protein ACOBQX_07905 [Actinokineospora sp. G85]|uniref:hypothetical protein n=1 Tax=Actinokineospora sp. G85 TaxID=3406626 RepID=UPI003C7068B5